MKYSGFFLVTWEIIQLSVTGLLCVRGEIWTVLSWPSSCYVFVTDHTSGTFRLPRGTENDIIYGQFWISHAKKREGRGRKEITMCRFNLQFTTVMQPQKKNDSYVGKEASTISGTNATIAILEFCRKKGACTHSVPTLMCKEFVVKSWAIQVLSFLFKRCTY